VSRLGGPQFPLRHPHLALVCGLLVTSTELGRAHELQFVLLTPDGQQLSNATATIRAEGPTEGRDTVLTFSLDMWNLAFPVAGDYSSRILVDGSERKRLPLLVERRDVPGAAGPLQAPPFPPPTGQA
jgi:hypothetical protein